MRERPVTRAQVRSGVREQAPAESSYPAQCNARVRIAVTGAGLLLMLAMIVPFTLLSHVARGVTLPGAGEPTAAEPMAMLAGSAPAQTLLDQGQANLRSASSSGQLSRAEAVALVQRRYHARVVRTHLLQDSHGRPMYEFRLLSTGGKVWTVRIDAYSGAELP